MASISTRDHAEIRRWAGAHGATPAKVNRTGGLLRFEFNQPPQLANISWDDFFRVFDERGLELVYDDQPGSRFHKLVYPEARPAAAVTAPKPRPRRRAGAPRPAAARKRAAKRAAAGVRLAGGSEAGRVTTRSSKTGKPPGKTTRKAASQRPSAPRRAA